MMPHFASLFVAAILSHSALGQTAESDHWEPGVTTRVYEVDQVVEQVPTLARDQTPNVDVVVEAIEFTVDDATPWSDATAPKLLILTGRVHTPVEGHYQFRVRSLAPTRLAVKRWPADHELRAESDGATDLAATPARPCEAGWHPFIIEVLIPDPTADGHPVVFEWRGPDDEAFTTIPADHLHTESIPTRVISPGTKRLASTRRPGDNRWLDSVHPAYDLVTLHPPNLELRVSALIQTRDGRTLFGQFLPLARSNVAIPDIESKPFDSLWELRPIPGREDDPTAVNLERVADGFFEPSGLCEVDGVLYVAHRRAITALYDQDDDGYFETQRDVARGWSSWNYHQFTFGLEHRNGRLYTALSTAMAPPGWEGMRQNAAPNDPHRGCMIEVDLSKADDPEHSFRVYAGGLRTPNTIGMGPDQQLFYADNQGTWMSTSQLAHVREGHFYGHFNNTNFVPDLSQYLPDGGHASSLAGQPRTPPVAWLPQNEFINSPTQPRLIEHGPYAGQMLLGELTTGGIRRIFLEKVNGQWQGAAFRFSQGFEAGVNRLWIGDDGSITVGCIGTSGGWSWRNLQHGLQRMVPNGKSVFEIHAVRALPDGFEITFTEPVDPEWLADASNFFVSDWTYEHTIYYGGPKIDERVLTVERSVPDATGQSVRLKIPNLRTGSCVYFRTDPRSVAGEIIWSTEAYYTLNQIPRAVLPAAATINGTPIDLSDAAFDGVGLGVIAPEGAITLIGRSHRDHMFFRTDDQPFMPRDGAVTQDELMTIDASQGVAVLPDGGNLVTAAALGDMRLHAEWLAPGGGSAQQGGNSGFYIQGRYELQVLATPDAATLGRPIEAGEAGGLYRFKAADVNASNGPDQWQAYDIWFRAPRFNEAGEKTEDARITVYWNGELVHHDVALPHGTGAGGNWAEAPAPGIDRQLEALVLQAHYSDANGPVRYRNVWVAPLESANASSTTIGPWRDLFADGTLDGWQIRGGEGQFAVERDDAGNNEIVGTATPGITNTTLVSETTFDNFELSFEVKSETLNSGFHFRTFVQDGFANREGNVVGPQVEVDPSARAFSGGIYDVNRRQWLAPLTANPAARSAWQPGEWNHINVVADGPLIRSWVNGVPAARTFLESSAQGHLGLQVHSLGADQDPQTVHYRNVRIRELD